MPRDHRRQTFDIEARHQGGHRIARLATRRPGRIGVVAAIRDRQHRFRTGHWAGCKGLASTQTHQWLTLLLQKRPQRVLGIAGHGHLLLCYRLIAYSLLIINGDQQGK
jgi:hypothetical protein